MYRSSGDINSFDPFPQVTKAVKQAAEATWLVRTDYRHQDIWSKADKTPVTVADLASQAILLSALAEVVPGEMVLAEEDAGELEDEDKASRVREIVEQVTGKTFANGDG